MKYLETLSDDEVTLIDALDALGDEVETMIVPCFLITNRVHFMRAVVEQCEELLKNPTFQRMYLFFQEGISKKKCQQIIKEINRRAQELPHADADPERLRVYSFGNVTTDLQFQLVENAHDVTIDKPKSKEEE